MDRDRARLRQLLLAAHEHGWPVSFFVVALVFVIYLLSGLPAGATAPTRPASAGRGSPRSGLMFSGFMVNAWMVGTIVAVVAGVVGFFIVLRGSAFAAHAMPNGSFAGAAGAA